jgi:hypothetical protein
MREMGGDARPEETTGERRKEGSFEFLVFFSFCCLPNIYYHFQLVSYLTAKSSLMSLERQRSWNIFHMNTILFNLYICQESIDTCS